MKSRPAPAANPFEARGNRRVKFDVLGARARGGERNVAAARAAAVERRRTSLGAELAAAGKSNAFVDRRFGENDPTLDDEARALQRMKRERLRQLRTSSKRARFQLDDDGGEAAGGSGGGGGGGETLTHMGRALSEWEAFGDGRGFAGTAGRRGGDGDGSDTDDDAVMDSAVTAAHFGGGRAVPHPDAPKTYEDVMAEVMAKSKAARAERAEEKAAQALLLEKLDLGTASVARMLAGANAAAAAFAAPAARPVVTTAAAKPFAPLPPSARERADSEGSEAHADFDSLVRELATHSRAAHARDRTKTAEEAAADEAERLRELESLRRQRMVGDGSGAGDDGGAGSHAPSAPGGDDLGPTFTTKTKRRRMVTPGASILDLAATVADGEASGSEEEGEEDTSDSDDDGSDDEDEEEEEDDGSDYDSALDDDDGSVGTADGAGDSGAGLASEAAVSFKRPAMLPLAAAVAAPAKPAAAPAVSIPAAAAPAGLKSADDMPFLLPCPASWLDWDGMVRAYVGEPRRAAVPHAPSAAAPLPAVAGRKRSRATREADDAANAAAAPGAAEEAAAAVATIELARRIRACHAIALKASHKAALCAMFDALVEDPLHAPAPWRVHAVATVLHSMAQEVPLAVHAATTWKAALQRLVSRVQRAIAKPALPEPGTADGAWLRLPELAQLRLAAAIFPLSDYRHVIVTTMRLLLAQCLAQAPVRTVHDVAAGLAHAALLIDLCAPGRKYAPEAIAFLGSSLLLFCPAAMRNSAGAAARLPVRMPTFAPLMSDAAQVASFASALRAAGAGGDLADAALPRQLFATCLRLLDSGIAGMVLPAADGADLARLAAAAASPAGEAAREMHGGRTGTVPDVLTGTAIPLAAAPEVLDPLLNALAAAVAGAGGDAEGATAAAVPVVAGGAAVLARLVARRDAFAAARRPMALHESATAVASALKTFAPLLEEEPAKGRPGSELGGASSIAAVDDGTRAAEARAEVRRLAKVKRREMRGAVRELRLDRQFIVRETGKAQEARDEERTRKYNEVMGFLEQQQATFNQLEKRGGRITKKKKTDGDEAAADELRGLSGPRTGAAGAAAGGAGGRLKGGARSGPSTKAERRARKMPGGAAAARAAFAKDGPR